MWLFRLAVILCSLALNHTARADTWVIDWTRMTTSRMTVFQGSVLLDIGASCSSVQVNYERSFLSVNGVPLIGAMRAGSYRNWDGAMESAHVDTPFDPVLLREGANVFSFNMDDGTFNACRAESGGFSLRGGPLGSRDLFQYLINWGTNAYSAAPINLSATVMLSLNQIDPQLSRDLASLDEAIRRDGDILVANATSYADLAEQLDQLRQLQTELQALLDRGFDELFPEDVELLLNRFSVIPPDTRAALVQIVADLKADADALRTELVRITNEHQAEVAKLVDVLDASTFSPTFNAADPAQYCLDPAIEDVPHVAIPEVAAVRPFDADYDPYDAYAGVVLAQLEQLVRDADVIDRVRFLGIVRAWRLNQTALKTAFDDRTGVSQAEWGAFLGAQQRVTEFLRKFLDASDWYRNSPASAQVRYIVDRVLVDRFGAAAYALKDGLNAWRGQTPTAEQALVLTTVEALGQCASAGANEDALLTLLNGAVVAVMEVGKIGASLTPLGDFIDLCEVITGRDFCSPTGEELTTLGRVASGVGLLLGSGKVWRAVGESVGAAAGITTRIGHIADRLSDLTRAERQALLQGLGKDAIAALEGLTGREIKKLVAAVGPSAARKYALRDGYAVFNRANYRQNFIILTGKEVPDAQVHHVIPQFLEEEMENILGLNIHDPRLLAWWNKAEHQALSSEYNQKWVDALDITTTTSADDILELARKISASYNYEVLF